MKRSLRASVVVGLLTASVAAYGGIALAACRSSAPVSLGVPCLLPPIELASTVGEVSLVSPDVAFPVVFDPVGTCSELRLYRAHGSKLPAELSFNLRAGTYRHIFQFGLEAGRSLVLIVAGTCDGVPLLFTQTIRSVLPDSAVTASATDGPGSRYSFPPQGGEAEGDAGEPFFFDEFEGCGGPCLSTDGVRFLQYSHASDSFTYMGGKVHVAQNGGDEESHRHLAFPSGLPAGIYYFVAVWRDGGRPHWASDLELGLFS